MIIDISPAKAQFISGQNVEIHIDIDEQLISHKATIELYSLNSLVKKISILLDSEHMTVSLGTFTCSFDGYGVDIAVEHEGTIVQATTSFDVVDNSNMSIRYGFLSDFNEIDELDNNDIEFMRKFHINYIQFYDWSYRHDHLVSCEDKYEDMMGKHISRDTIKTKILLAHKYGIKTMAYGAVYAASSTFYEKHKDWALYTSADEPFRFIDVFTIMNIEPDCPWHEHIIEQYKNAIEKMGFDGIHMDTYGFPKTAYSHYGSRHIVHLADCFPTLINDVKNELESVKNTDLIFNNVGNWPVNCVANSAQSAIYIEVWNPYERYFHIKKIIDDAKKARHDSKPIILAAYLAPFRLENITSAMFSAFILTAVIASNGAYHLLIGEDSGILTQGYYSDYSVIPAENINKLKVYYDFIVRYMNLLYDNDLIDVSMTHLGGDNDEYYCNFDNWSPYGEPNKIMVNIYEKPLLKVIYLINLCGCYDDYWNKGKSRPVTRENLEFRVRVDYKVKGVYSATPDDGMPASISLPFRYGKDDKGKYIEFIVPDLHIWRMVYIMFDI